MTQIFRSYSEFVNREDKAMNGVSEEFAQLRPDYEKQNETNYGCWNCSDCYGCSRCSGCSGCSGCYGCSRCSDCSGCSGCYGCYGCYGCSDCSDCSGLKNAATVQQESGKGFPATPVIENIHAKVLAAVSNPAALDMRDWHSCETTHCRAGWVVHLAGKAGYDLEKATTTPFAAMQIYKASSAVMVSPTRFYESNEVAMADIKRCAEAESKKITI